MNQITVKYKVQNTYSQSTTNFVLVYQKCRLIIPCPVNLFKQWLFVPAKVLLLLVKL